MKNLWVLAIMCPNVHKKLMWKNLKSQNQRKKQSNKNSEDGMISIKNYCNIVLNEVLLQIFVQFVFEIHNKIYMPASLSDQNGKIFTKIIFNRNQKAKKNI
ncbi:hypothetical protein BpHYR1_035093 [Brachionus plicatilis]|uniref:Uncharacterized protein n=1 Tax=Brachionus plicatilis TaxID=10195 RepID=A0A3M7RI77_BRAPC|nr:hypothetical protein BpHYR1_035093 [Brachionus plicatilis]